MWPRFSQSRANKDDRSRTNKVEFGHQLGRRPTHRRLDFAMPGFVSRVEKRVAQLEAERVVEAMLEEGRERMGRCSSNRRAKLPTSTSVSVVEHSSSVSAGLTQILGANDVEPGWALVLGTRLDLGSLCQSFPCWRVKTCIAQNALTTHQQIIREIVGCRTFTQRRRSAQLHQWSAARSRTAKRNPNLPFDRGEDQIASAVAGVVALVTPEIHFHRKLKQSFFWRRSISLHFHWKYMFFFELQEAN